MTSKRMPPGPTLHGRTARWGDVTLAGMRLADDGGPVALTPDPFSRSQWQPRRVVLGECITDETRIYAVDVQMTDVDDWVVEVAKDKNLLLRLKMGMDVADGRVRILRRGIRSEDPFGAPRRGGWMFKEYRVRFEFKEPQTLEGVHLRAVAPLEAMMTVTQLRPAYATDVRIHTFQDGLDIDDQCPSDCAGLRAEGLSMWSNSDTSLQPNTGARLMNWAWFDCTPENVERWFDLYHRNGQALDSLAQSSVVREDVRARFQTLAATLEGLEKAQTGRGRSDFGNSYKYAEKRLAPLLNGLPTVEAGPRKYSTLMTMRNGLAHSTDDPLRGLDADDKFDLANRTLMAMCLGLVARHLNLQYWNFTRLMSELTLNNPGMLPRITWTLSLAETPLWREP